MTPVSLFARLSSLLCYPPSRRVATTATAAVSRQPISAPRRGRAHGAFARAATALGVAVALAAAAPADARKLKRAPRVNVSTELPGSVARALERAHVPLASVSVVIERIGNATPLVALNATKAMLPASTMKLVTTYAGLSMLGPDYRWRTRAYADGTVDPDGVLHGDLYIQGTGDPKLVPEELVELVDKIRKAGIRGIDGALVLDKRFFAPSTRDLPPFDDDTNAPYNVGPDPLLYAFKSLSFTLTPSGGGAVAVDVLPPLAQLKIDNALRATPGACVSTDALTPSVTPQPDGTVDALFSGDYPLRCGPRTVNLAVLDHTAFFAGGFLALWRQQGGTFKGTTHEGAVPLGARLVATHHGPVLSDIVRDINKFSNNVMARNLFLTIGAVAQKPPATPEKSAESIERFLHGQGLSMPSLTLANGSGLSRDEHVSALGLAELLQAANASPVAQSFVESLPVAGVDGTMRNRLRNEPVLGSAHIKTGTLRDVRAIAGYVAAANGESYVVVSLINDEHAAAARAAHDALLEWVYRGMR
ncbi:D-alanyl-D-alanine carboxypeptidase/D-alanyl-D-alanine-endopeptidase [Trinickia caryophylli]|uniref:D-alanyl-D-alanine carboxypeptidase / D-alanyl-D-alanine-endopeptidase (Penicillin-binding protein 4) n=1 Tax=Trinickia caryophylli TaxID=28094 RepID=A0A1X7EX89_TRICW|nr:D-alanyl-D-alanine carboxypeptidase/D-alanyl-D-alanine-endopeptidase [Trinickia caryophylli]PMS09668.1 D-alanyl-D-alanine carboxypeptidase/D-alanyl-D-alanine-endopeptidase [Trinickia caryophylli]TRX18437.1 D-alanyl-D-alanine carboxypeptidase/D-alanyl-D-alanine-endopeptidase [Trinickia caryophylli]WQE10778.1 D-alanyl-D-alanine carboxypeptidase/D-alanyl-D-alanine-endopeptidase [Trinickia caryophylli]SMF41981.1 D-alanyl-D-alanine carboxypeptidase / D-alanyl-D-alanine-endopeptidase (penicillin-b